MKRKLAVYLMVVSFIIGVSTLISTDAFAGEVIADEYEERVNEDEENVESERDINASQSDAGETVIASGSCGKNGDNLHWTLTQDTLRISGTGEMDGYSASGKGTIKYAPWCEYECPENLILEEGITSIGSDAFSYLGFRGGSKFKGSLSIPSTVTKIGYGAFEGCSGFTGELNLPSGVTDISSYAFSGCKGFTGNLVIPTGVKKLYADTFVNCTGLNGNLVLPDNLEMLGGFNGCKNLLWDMNIPEGVKTITANAFSGCELLNGQLTFPNSIESIGEAAFLGCSNINGELVLPAKLKTLGSRAFSGCNGIEGMVTIPSTVTSVGYIAGYAAVGPETDGNVFSGCSNIICFVNYSKSELKLPLVNGKTWTNYDGETITRISEGIAIRSDYEWKDVELVYEYNDSDKTATVIGYNGLPIGKLVIPDTYRGYQVIGIADGVFNDCKWLSGNLVLPNKIKHIGNNAFKGCSGFSGTLTIPASVEYVGEDALLCSGLSEIDNNSNITVTLPSVTPFYWADSETGMQILELSGGKKAIRSDESNKIEALSNTVYKLATANYMYGNANIDVTKEAYSIESDHEPFSLICSTANGGVGVLNYELYYGGEKIAENETGEFKDIDIKKYFVSADKMFIVKVNGTEGSSYTTLLLNAKVKALTCMYEKFAFTGKGLEVALNEDIPIIGGSTVNMEFTDMPISYEITENKIKIGINLKPSAWKDKDDKDKDDENKKKEGLSTGQRYENWKKKVADSQMISDDLDDCLMNKNVQGWVPGYEESVGYKVFGYLEGEFSEKSQTVQGEIILTLYAKAERDGQSFVWVGTQTVPVTYKLSLECKAKIDGRIKWDLAKNTVLPSEADIKVNLSVSLDAYGGVGVGEWLSGGVYGIATLGSNITLVSYEESGINGPGLDDLYLSGEAGVRGYFAKMSAEKCLFSLDDLKERGIWIQYIDGNKLYILSRTRDAIMPYPIATDLKDNALRAEQNYASRPINVELGELTASSVQAGFKESGLWIKDAYQGANVQAVSTGDDTVIIFIDSDGAQTIAKYAVFDKKTGVINEALPLVKDETDDTNPYLYTDGKDIYCAFLNSSMNCRDINISDEKMNDYLKSFGVTVCKYNRETKVFNKIGSFDTNRLCYSVKLANSKNGLCVAWAQNETNTFLGLNSENSIKKAYYNGNNWGNVETVAAGLNSVSSIAVDITGSVAWIEDADNSLTTENHILKVDSEIKTEGNISNIEYTFIPGVSKSVLAFNDNGGLKYLDGSNTVTVLPENTMDKGSKFSTDNGKIFYLKTSDDSRNVRSAFYKNNLWNEGLLTGTDDYVDCFSVSDGKLFELTSIPSFNNIGEIDVASSIYVFDDARNELELLGIYCEEDKVSAGQELQLQAMIRNNGTEIVNSFSLRYNGKSQPINTVIMPGESKQVTAYFDIPSDLSNTQNVYLDVENDADTSNNEKQLVLDKTDISVTGKYIVSDSGRIVKATVYNNSNINTTMRFSVLDPEGVKIYSANSYIENNSSKEYLIDVESLIPADGTGSYVTLCVETDDEEYYYSNNVSTCGIWDAEPSKTTVEVNNTKNITYGQNSESYWIIDSQGNAVVYPLTNNTSGRISTALFNSESYSKINTVTFSDGIKSVSTTAVSKCTALKKVIFINKECTLPASSSFAARAIISGYYGSKAHQYSNSYSRVFEAIDSKTHDHKWNTGVIIKDPTCDEDGIKQYTCEYCKATYDERLSQIGATTENGNDDDDDDTEPRSGVYIIEEEGGFVYTGKQIKPMVEVYDDDKLLRANTDYTLKYSNNINAGQAIVTVAGKGNYTKNQTATFDISKKNLGDGKDYENDIYVTVKDKQYTGKSVISKPVVTYNKIKLSENKDYTLSYSSDTVNTGRVQVYITGKGNYEGTITSEYKIYEKGANFSSIVADKIPNQVFTGKRLELNSDDLKIYTNSKKTELLIPDKDYTVKYTNNINVGTASAIITGIGKYEGYGNSKSLSFKIVACPLEGASIEIVGGAEYSGIKVEPQIKLKLKGETINPANYTVTFKNNVNVTGQGHVVSIKGKGNYTGTISDSFEITPKALTSSDVSISVQNIKYADKEILPKDVKCTVKYGKKTLVNGKDYAVEFAMLNNSSVQNATIRFTGNYSGQVECKVRLYGENIKMKLSEYYSVYVDDVKHTGRLLKPKVKVVDNLSGKILASSNYSVDYFNNTDVSDTKPYVALTGKNLCEGYITANFRIYEKNISTVNVDNIPSEYYTGEQIKPESSQITVYSDKNKGTILSENVHYVIEYGDNVNVGKGSVIIKGVGAYGGAKVVKFNILPRWLHWIIK